MAADRPDEQRCGNCFYYRYRSLQLHPDGTLYYMDNVEVCKRHPPAVALRAQDRYPVPAAGDWCGDWAPKDPQTLDEGAVTMARFVILGDLTSARGLADRLRE